MLKKIAIFLFVTFLALQLNPIELSQAKKLPTKQSVINNTQKIETNDLNTYNVPAYTSQPEIVTPEELKKQKEIMVKNLNNTMALISTQLENEAINEEDIKTICSQTENPEICETLLNELYSTYQNINTDEIKESIENKLKELSTLNDAFLKYNQSHITNLKIQAEILQNHLGENQASKEIFKLISKMEFKTNDYTDKFTNLYNLSLELISNPPKNKESLNKAIETFNSELTIYTNAFIQLVNEYPACHKITNTTTHYLRGLINGKNLQNHELYTKDLLSLLLINETYYQADATEIKNLINDTTVIDEETNQEIINKGLLTIITDTLPLIEENNINWYDSYFTDSEEQKEKTRKSQIYVNLKLAEIYSTEVKIAREICEMRNSEDFALCEYAFGTAIKAFLNDENIAEAVCAQMPDPAKCLATKQLITEALDYAIDSEEETWKAFMKYIAAEKLPEEEYQSVIEFIAQTMSFAQDSEFTEEEKQILKESLTSLVQNSEYINDQIDNTLENLCKNQTNPQECAEMAKEMLELGKSIYEQEASFEEAIAITIEYLKENIKYTDPESIQAALDQLYDLMDQSIIYSEITSELLNNRELGEYKNQLIEIKEQIKLKKENLITINSKLSFTLTEINEIKAAITESKNVKEIAELSKQLALLSEQAITLAAEFGLALNELEKYYIEKYLPTTYSATWLNANFGYEKNLKNSILYSENLQDIITIIEINNPSENLTRVKAEAAEINTLAKNLLTLIPQTNTEHKNLLASDEPKKYFDENPVKSLQDQLNEGMKNLTEAKFFLIYNSLPQDQEQNKN